MIGTSKKLIIVCDEKTRGVANYIRQLISTNDDKDGETVGIVDGSVETAVWTDKEYLANSATVSSNEHILFVGKNKVSKSESKYMNIEFNMFGMKYGWLGKRAMLCVEDELLDKEKYENFIRYSSTYDLKFDKLGYKDIKLLETSTEKDVKAIENVSESIDDSIENDDSNHIQTVEIVATSTIKNPVDSIIPAVNGMKKGLNNLSAHIAHKKINDQQYRALSVIFYLEGLKSFLEA